MSSTALYISAISLTTLSLLALTLAASFFLPDHVSLPFTRHAHADMQITRRLPAALVGDEHYKYLVPLLVPTTAYFVIANWVGWEYFRYA
jgi:hypothetical protein